MPGPKLRIQSVLSLPTRSAGPLTRPDPSVATRHLPTLWEVTPHRGCLSIPPHNRRNPSCSKPCRPSSCGGWRQRSAVAFLLAVLCAYIRFISINSPTSALSNSPAYATVCPGRSALWLGALAVVGAAPPMPGRLPWRTDPGLGALGAVTAIGRAVHGAVAVACGVLLGAGRLLRRLYDGAVHGGGLPGRPRLCAAENCSTA